MEENKKVKKYLSYHIHLNEFLLSIKKLIDEKDINFTSFVRQAIVEKAKNDKLI